MPHNAHPTASIEARIDAFEAGLAGAGGELRAGGAELRRAAWDVAMQEQLRRPGGRAHHDAVAGELYGRYRELVTTAERALRRTGGHARIADAEDLVQVAALQTAVFAFRRECSLIKVYTAIVKRRALDASGRSRREVSADAGWDDGERSLTGRIADPEADAAYRAVADADEARALLAEVEARGLLSPAQREAVEAIARHDGDLAAAAEELGTTVTVLTSRTYEARRKLRAVAPERFGAR